MLKRRAFWREFFGVLTFFALIFFILYGLAHAGADTGNIRIARPPARDGSQVVCVQEDGKSMAQGGWHWVRTYLSGGQRFYMGDIVHLIRDEKGHVVGISR